MRQSVISQKRAMDQSVLTGGMWKPAQWRRFWSSSCMSSTFMSMPLSVTLGSPRDS